MQRCRNLAIKACKIKYGKVSMRKRAATYIAEEFVLRDFSPISMFCKELEIGYAASYLILIYIMYIR